MDGLPGFTVLKNGGDFPWRTVNVITNPGFLSGEPLTMAISKNLDWSHLRHLGKEKSCWGNVQRLGPKGWEVGVGKSTAKAMVFTCCYHISYHQILRGFL